MARKLRGDGFDRAYALKGGWREWQRSQFPVEEK
jgi:rhodanese-related sulfurtransferase